MKRRVHIIATWVSGGLLVVCLGLAIASNWLNPWDHRLSLSSTFHIGVWGRGLDVRLVFFNDAEYGPYRGSAIGLVDAQGIMYPPLKRNVRFGDLLGVYYRYLQWTDATVWTLMIWIWYPAALFAILPVRAWRHRTRKQDSDSPAPDLPAQLTDETRDGE